VLEEYPTPVDYHYAVGELVDILIDGQYYTTTVRDVAPSGSGDACYYGDWPTDLRYYHVGQ